MSYIFLWYNIESGCLVDVEKPHRVNQVSRLFCESLASPSDSLPGGSSQIPPSQLSEQAFVGRVSSSDSPRAWGGFRIPQQPAEASEYLPEPTSKMSSVSLSSAAALLVQSSPVQPEEALEYPRQPEEASEYPRQLEEASEYPKQPEEASEYPSYQ